MRRMMTCQVALQTNHDVRTIKHGSNTDFKWWRALLIINERQIQKTRNKRQSQQNAWHILPERLHNQTKEARSFSWRINRCFILTQILCSDYRSRVLLNWNVWKQVCDRKSTWEELCCGACGALHTVKKMYDQGIKNDQNRMVVLYWLS